MLCIPSAPTLDVPNAANGLLSESFNCRTGTLLSTTPTITPTITHNFSREILTLVRKTKLNICIMALLFGLVASLLLPVALHSVHFSQLCAHGMGPWPLRTLLVTLAHPLLKLLP